MRRVITHWHLALLAIAALCLVYFKKDGVWSESVDLAHHYALTYRLMEGGQLDDTTLGEMSIYPRLGHQVAAILGTVVGSPFLGLHLVALGSISMLWGAVLSVLGALPGRLPVLCAMALAILTWANRRWLGIDVHGSELVANYFYAQAVAQALAWSAIAVAIRLERSRNASWATAWLIGAMAVCTFVHLLPAMEMLGMLFFIIAIDLAQKVRARITDKRIFATAIGAVVVATSVVLFNPSFAAMRKISDNNGELNLNLLSYPLGLAGLAVSTLAIALIAFTIWWRSSRQSKLMPLKYLAALAGAMALLCLVQMALAHFGFGSPYAAKKYSFGLASCSLVFLALAAAAVVDAAIRRLRPNEALPAGPTVWQSAALAASLIAISLSAFAQPPILQASSVVEVERRLQQVGLPLQGAEWQKPDVIIDLRDLHPTFNYMFSISMARTPRILAIPDLLQANELREPRNYRYVVSDVGSERYVSPGCTVRTDDSLVVSDASCLAQRLEERRHCQGSFDLSSASFVEGRMLSGFSHAEPHGRWTSLPASEFKCDASGFPPRLIRLSVAPFVAGATRMQRLRLSVNGRSLGEYELKDHGREVVIEASIPSTLGLGQYVFRMDLPDAVSPKAIGLSGDARQLGVALRTVSFE